MERQDASSDGVITHPQTVCPRGFARAPLTSFSGRGSQGWKTCLPMHEAPANFFVIRIGSQLSCGFVRLCGEAVGQRRGDGGTGAVGRLHCVAIGVLLHD